MSSRRRATPELPQFSPATGRRELRRMRPARTALLASLLPQPSRESALSLLAPVQAPYTPLATRPDSYIENGGDADAGNTAWRRVEAPRSHRPLPAVPRWRRSPWALHALHSKGSHGAAQPRTSRSQPSSSEAMRAVRSHRRHKHGRVRSPETNC